ncbi:putative exodeoxyribonuclease VIII [Klebsiella pneumoniae]|uniref:Putative exodeoxyribonuclease VIII n=1 Tax=Klebsiella pneumoniae TaxID=573 RepID=A0A2X3CCD2_KLEPN|nr:putative exodeoxyribonuclease VIII [Klebsiella pneumoniae]
MTIYNGLFEPKKSAIKDCGAVQLAIAVEAPNKKIAESIITGKLWESYPANGDNYFKPKLWEHEEGQPLPTVGQFDELFAQQHTFDGEKWVSIAANGTAGEESNLPAGDDVIDLMTVSPRERFAAVLLFSKLEMNGQLYSQVVDYLDDLDNHDETMEEDDRFNFNVLCALHNNEPVKHMHVEGLNNLIQGIFSHFENQTPGKAAISQFVKRWLENPGKREEMVPGQNSSLGTASTDSNVKIAPKRGYKHTYATLDQEIAVALLPISPDAPVLSGNLRDAEKIIADEREDFKRWSMALRTTEHILKYDRDSIFGVVQNVPAKDTYHFPDSLRRHIDSWLEANGRFEETETGSVKQPEATQNTASNVVEKAEALQPVVTDTQAKQARETLNDMGYGVYASDNYIASEPEEKLSVKAQRIADDGEQLVEHISQKETMPSAEEVVRSVGNPGTEQDNLALWKRVFKTDERFTKAFTQNGGGTSINGTYLTMLATREFGLKGSGWGVDILEERFDDGAPITRTVKGTDGNNTWELISDGNGGFLTEKHHVMKIRLWYLVNDVRGEEYAYGCTPYIYGSKYGPICDGEAAKKSLTDATKKALSGLGFSGDIFMGLYDNLEYRQKNKAEFDLKNASETAEDAARLRQEFDDKLSRVANTLAHGVTVNELNGVFSPIAREIDVHIKAAQANGDAQHERYLSGRLRRLIAIKDGRIKELNKAEEKA